MKKHQIFVGELPPVTVEVAMKLAIYWRVAGDCVGIIDENGCLRYGENSVWLRPMAQKSFWVLKEAEAKRTGKGIGLHPRHTDFTLPDARVFETDGCILAVIY